MGNCGIWKSVGEGGPYADRMVWETLTGNCTARELWKDVRSKCWGNRKGIETVDIASLEPGISQMDEKNRSYPPVFIIAKIKEKSIVGVNRK